MHRLIVTMIFALATLWPQPSFAQSRSQLGPLCTTDGTPADAQIDACNKIIALKAFSGQQLATIYFWRAVGWNKRGNYTQVDIGHYRGDPACAEPALLQPARLRLLRQRRVRYRDIGLQRCAADGSADGIVFHNRANAWRGKGEYTKAIADYDASIKSDPKSPFSWQNRGISRQALGDLDGAIADINEAIRLAPALPQPLTNRAVIWRAKGDYDRAIADGTEAIRLAKNPPPNIMTPPGSVMISAYINRALSYEAKGDYEHARADFSATLQGTASDAASKANQATARVRLSLLSDPNVAPREPRRRPLGRPPRRHRRRRNQPCKAGAWRW